MCFAAINDSIIFNRQSFSSVLRSSGVTFEERFGFFLNLLDILESVWKREAHGVRQHEGTNPTKNSEPSEEAERHLLWNLGRRETLSIT